MLACDSERADLPTLDELKRGRDRREPDRRMPGDDGLDRRPRSGKRHVDEVEIKRVSFHASLASVPKKFSHLYKSKGRLPGLPPTASCLVPTPHSAVGLR